MSYIRKCPICGAVFSSTIKPVKCPICRKPWAGSNPYPAKMIGTRTFSGMPYYYAGRIIYPSKAKVVAQELRQEGIESKITPRRESFMLWTNKPRYVDLEEPLRNPKRRKRTLNKAGSGLVIAALVGLGIWLISRR